MSALPAADDAGGPAIVIDAGSGTVKAGFSGEDAPRVLLPTVLGRVDDLEAFRGGAGGGGAGESDLLLGSDALAARDRCTLTSPIERGVVTDWDALEKLWDYIFDTELRLEAEVPILMADAPFTSWAAREQAARIMFEKYNVPGFYVMNQSTLSLFSCGSTRGIVVESGQGVSSAVPVFEGYALPHAIQHSPLAGADVTDFLASHFDDRLSRFPGAGADVLREIKETLCYVPLAGAEPVGGEKVFELPDGQLVAVPDELCAKSAQLLFEPKLALSDKLPAVAVADADAGAAAGPPSGISQLAIDSIDSCDSELQLDLLSNVVVAGGSSMLPGFADRLAADLKAGFADGRSVNVTADSQRKYAAWIGGSMFASLSTFKSWQISKADYEEHHETVVHRRCL